MKNVIFILESNYLISQHNKNILILLNLDYKFYSKLIKKNNPSIGG